MGRLNRTTFLPNRRLPVSLLVDQRRFENNTNITPTPTNEDAYSPASRSTLNRQIEPPARQGLQTQRLQQFDPSQTTEPTNSRDRLQHTMGRRFPQPHFSPVHPRRARDIDEPEPTRNVRPRAIVTNRLGDPKFGAIRLATLNIISGRAERLVSATRALQQMNVDVAVLTETKITDECYTRHSFGYEIRASKAPSSSQGGVAFCWRDNEISQTEGIRFHGCNVVSCEVTSGKK
jgi:hypothetical protein